MGCPGEKTFELEAPSFRKEYKQEPSRCARKSLRYRTKLKLWFLPWIWDVSMQRAAAGWDIKIRTYNLVPNNAPIFKLVMRGDTVRVHKMMKLGMASPYDQCDKHGSVAKVAVGGDLSLVRQCEISFEGIDSADLLEWSLHLTEAEVQHNWVLFILEELRADLEDQQNPTTEHFSLWEYVCSPDAARLLVRQSIGRYGRLATREVRYRLEVAWSNAPEKCEPWGRSYSLSLLMELLCWPEIDEALATLSTPTGENLVHFVPVLLNSDEDWTVLVPFVRQLNQAGADFHKLAGHRFHRTNKVTPMMRWVFDICGRLQSWVRLLEAAGVDIMLYGEREAYSWRELCSVIWQKADWRETGVEYWYWFDYGPKVTDWNLHKRSRIRIDMYEMRCPGAPPGSWPVEDNPLIPIRIFWQPNDAERQQGDWKFIDSIFLHTMYSERVVHSTPMAVETRLPRDDQSQLCLQMREAQLERTRLRKSYSQPEFRSLGLHKTNHCEATFYDGRIFAHQCTLGTKPRKVFLPGHKSSKGFRYCVQHYRDTSWIDWALGYARRRHRDEANVKKAQRHIDEEYARRFPND